MIESDYAVGFKQGQAHGKQIMQERIDEAIDEINKLQTYKLCSGDSKKVELAEVLDILKKCEVDQ